MRVKVRVIIIITSNGRGVLSMRNPAHNYSFFFPLMVQLVGLHVRGHLSWGEKCGKAKKIVYTRKFK